MEVVVAGNSPLANYAKKKKKISSLSDVLFYMKKAPKSLQ